MNDICKKVFSLAGEVASEHILNLVILYKKNNVVSHSIITAHSKASVSFSVKYAKMLYMEDLSQ